MNNTINHLKNDFEVKYKEKMKVKIKKSHPSVNTPSYAKNGDAGIDLKSISRTLVTSEVEADYIEYGTGLFFEIPKGYVGLIFPRSSNSKKDLTLCNSVGIIDSGYRGEIKLRYKIDATYNNVIEVRDNYVICELNNLKFKQSIYDIGEKIGQIIIIPYPQIEFEKVEELSDTERGDSGFGSSGR